MIRGRSANVLSGKQKARCRSLLRRRILCGLKGRKSTSPASKLGGGNLADWFLQISIVLTWLFKHTRVPSQARIA